MFGSFVFFFIIRVLSQNERYTLVNKRIEQAIFVMPWVNFMNMFLPVARDKIYDSWIDHMDIQTKASDWSIWFSVGMIHVVTGYWSKSQGVLVMSPTRSSLVSMSFHVTFIRFFSAQLAFPKGSAWVFCENFWRAKKKMPRNGGEIVHYCCRNSLYKKNYHLLGSPLKFGAKCCCFCVEIWAFFGGTWFASWHKFLQTGQKSTLFSCIISPLGWLCFCFSTAGKSSVAIETKLLNAPQLVKSEQIHDSNFKQTMQWCTHAFHSANRRITGKKNLQVEEFLCCICFSGFNCWVFGLYICYCTFVIDDVIHKAFWGWCSSLFQLMMLRASHLRMIILGWYTSNKPAH